MKRIYSLLIYIVFINTFPALATTYTWTGNTSTAWNTTSNWSPSGTPTTGDFVHIYSATYNPQLPGNLTLNGIYMHSGTLNLNGDTLLLNSGTSTFSGGTISNGLLQLRGTEITFNSTTFNAPIDAVVDRINLNGCTFNNYCYFETISNVPGTGSGGAVFNDSVYLYHNYTGSGIWVMNNNTGHRFNGKVTIHNKGTKEITFTGAGINVFNGDIVLINTGAGGIMLGNDTLTAGHTISIGSGGFSAGDFNATNFYQDGNTAISLTFTGTALPSITGATFGGNFSITSNVLLFKNCTFSGTASFTATGSGSSSWYGGNTFYGNATFTNNATAGNLRIDADTANTYYADATFNGSRELRVCYGGDVSSFYGNITTANNTTFNAGTGTLCLAGSGTQSLSFHSNTLVKNLMLNKSGGSAALSTALVVSGTVTFAKGTLTTTSSNLLTINNGGTVSGASDSSFIDGPVKKIGNAAFVFPTGKGLFFRALGISSPSTSTDSYIAEYFDVGQTLGTNKDSSLENLSECGYWNLIKASGSSSITVTLNWTATPCKVSDTTGVNVARWNGSTWESKGKSAISVGITNGYVATENTLSTVGYFTYTYRNLPSECNTENTTSSLPACGTSSNYIPSFPASSMPVKTIKLNFIFVTNTNPNLLRNFNMSNSVERTYFQNDVMNYLNAKYGTIVQPTASACSSLIHTINDTRIRFVLNGIYAIADAFGSDQGNYSRCPGNGHYLQTLLKGNIGKDYDEAINVVFTDNWCYQDQILHSSCDYVPNCTCVSTGNNYCGAGGCSWFPGGDECTDNASMILMNNYYLGYRYNICNGFSILSGFVGIATTLAHELGHSFGLVHKSPGCNHVMVSAGGYNYNFWELSELGIMHSNIEYGMVSKYRVESDYNNTNTVTIPAGTSQTWTIARVIGGDLIIEPGATLEVQCKVKMPEGGKIIIERGGKLDVNGGLLTANSCAMWEGVEVWGDETKNQTQTNPGTGAIYQGKIILRNGGGIEHAHNAVVLGKPSGAGFASGYGGGIISASGSTFSQNGADVRFAPYSYAASISQITASTLSCASPLRDKGYDLTSASAHYPTSIHPFYAPANKTGRTAYGIYPWKVRGLYAGPANSFSNIERAVYIIDSKINVVSNTFNNHTYSIMISNSTSPVQYGNYISGNTFNNAMYHIFDGAGKFDNIVATTAINYFNSLGASPTTTVNTFGIYLQAASGFNVKDNDFLKLKYANVINNSGTTGGFIGYQSAGNKYTDCELAISGSLDNSKLTIRCNNYFTNLPAFYSGKSWNISGNIATQGAYTANPFEVQKPAGNRFANSSANHINSQNITNALGQLYYYRHNVGLGSDPTVDFTPTGLTKEIIDVPVVFSAIDPNIPCAPPCNPPCNSQAAFRTAIDSLASMLDSIKAHVENENTAGLIEAAVSGSSVADVMALLKDASPLSDSVLKTLSRETTILPDDSLKAIFILNSRMSADVAVEIAEAAALDSAAKAEIIAKQTEGFDYTTVESLRAQIEELKLQKQTELNDMIRYYADNDSSDYAMALLITESDDGNRQTLFSSYLAAGVLDSAASVLEALINEADTDADWITVQSMLFGLASDSLTVFDIDSTQHATLYAIAEKTESSLATAQARTILRQVFNESWEEEEDAGARYMNAVTMAENATDKKQESITPQLLLQPNPAKESVKITYYIPSETTASAFQITDVLGRVRFSIDIPPGGNYFVFPLKNLDEGLYVCKIAGKNISLTKKLVVIK